MGPPALGHVHAWLPVRQSADELGVQDDWSWVQVLTWPFIYCEA